MSEAPRLARTVAELQEYRRALRASGQPLVLVPTMGDLHAGHLELARVGVRLGPVVVSIFVNPTQFGPGEDFASYPRDLDGDRRKLAALDASLCIFAPAVEAIYDADSTTSVEVGVVSEPLCGVHRPGHFRGVATVVTKLFALVQPDVAIFGEKDAQQCLVLQRMVRDLRLPVRLLFVPTVRESDGLAMSSRNRYLDSGQRLVASRLHAALAAAESALRAGERSARRVESAMVEACDGIALDYAELRALPDLRAVERAEGRILLAIAGRLGRARLIDNRALAVDAHGVAPIALLEECREQTVRRELHAQGFALAQTEER